MGGGLVTTSYWNSGIIIDVMKVCHTNSTGYNGRSVLEVQIPDKAVCISLHVNVLGKGINLFFPQLWVNSRIDSFFSFG